MTNSNTIKEILPGLNGAGETVHIVFVTINGKLEGYEVFETLEEAKIWVDWA